MRRRPRELSDGDYERLLQLRSGLRRFLNWSRAQAADAGVTPTQHLLLLAVRGHGDGDPTVGAVAEHLQLRHHSAVELVDRAAAAGLVERRPDPDDQRRVRVALTPAGAEILERISLANLPELEQLAPLMTRLWDEFDGLVE